MNKSLIIALAFLTFSSCKEGEEKALQENSEEKTKSADSSQTIEEDLGYTLGIRSDRPLTNIYGQDSTDAEGNNIYPPRDTMWHDDPGYTLSPRPDKALINMYGEDSTNAKGDVLYPPRDTIWNK
jgi:hypothetical protein